MMDLTQLTLGKEGEVIEIQGGYGLTSRMESLGIIPGVKIKKVSSQLMQGPVTIQVGRTNVAIGFNAAKKIIVKETS